jgi:hypothetical protein
MLLRAASRATVAAAFLAPALSLAQTRANMEISTGATAASNPYLVEQPDTAAAGASLTFAPSLTFDAGDASGSLDGSLDLEKYFGRYGLDESAMLRASGERHVDERTTVTANVGFRSSKSAARRFYGDSALTPVASGDLPAAPLVDPTLANFGGRTSRLDVNAGIEHQTDPNSTFSASTGVGLTRVRANSGQDYRDASFSLGYQRRLDERTSVLTTLNAGYADYLSQLAGDGAFGTVMAGLDRQVSQSLHFSAQFGASLADVTSLGGGKGRTITWAGRIDACEAYPTGSACLTGERSARPTALGGITTVTSTRASYQRSLGIDADLSLTATYARSIRSHLPLSAPVSGQSELVAVSGTYRHAIGERLSAFVTPSATMIEDDISGRRKDYQVLIGLSYRFGTTP